MKKILSILFSLISLICIPLAFGGCGDKQAIKEIDEEINSGYIYDISYAYEMGMITYEQAKSIIYYHNVGTGADAEMLYGSYQPLPKTVQQLTKKKEKVIKQAYINTILRLYADAKPTDVSVDEYYGTYDGYIAVLMSDTFNGTQHNQWVERFEDFRISHDNGSNILIWRKNDEPVEVKGTFYDLEDAYENGWLDEEDLKSIACEYYNWYFNYEENPYSGMYTSTEELTDKMETELKQAYLKQVVGLSNGDRSRVKIYHYYGTYNGNVVVDISSNYVFIDPAPPVDTSIGGVIFKEYWVTQFAVYHINKI